MSDFSKEIVLVLLAGAVPVLFGYIVWLLKQQNKERKANSNANMLLLRVHLIEYHDRYIAAGEIPSYAYQNFNEMYETYTTLGGNGMVKKMHEEIEELHLKRRT